MKTSLLSLFAGTVFLAGSSIASAGEVSTLTSAELDAVTAGTTIAALVQANINRVRVSQEVELNAYNFVGTATVTGTNTSTVTITNTNTNSGAITAVGG